MTPRTADFIEETKSQKTEDSVRPRKKAKIHPNSLKNLQPYKPGAEWKGNPGGRPKVDVAALLAREVIEESYGEAKEGLKAQLRKGNAYAFKEMAERGYGKLKESKEITHTYNDVSDADLDKRIAELERDLGLAAEIDRAGKLGVAAAGENKTNGAAKDTKVLS